MELENEFYVCLLSNSTAEVYQNNTLSSFTNLLSKPCRLDQNWVVGLVEISFNKFKQSESLKIAPKINYDQLETMDDDVEIIPIKRKRQTSDLLELQIGNNENDRLLVYYRDFKEMCYKPNDINFSTFLSKLNKLIYVDDTKD